MTTEEVEAFLGESRTMNVATLGPGGQPHLVAMWYGFLRGAPALWTYGRSQKVLNLRRDPRLTCLVEAGHSYDTLRGVELVGRAEILEEPEDVAVVGASVLARYTATMEPTAREALSRSGAKRVAVRIVVHRVVSWDHAKLAGA